jgi:hypothetical protein
MGLDLECLNNMMNESSALVVISYECTHAQAG